VARVLLCDPDLARREAIATALAPLAVVATGSDEAALEELSRTPPDLILVAPAAAGALLEHTSGAAVYLIAAAGEVVDWSRLAVDGVIVPPISRELLSALASAAAAAPLDSPVGLMAALGEVSLLAAGDGLEILDRQLWALAAAFGAGDAVLWGPFGDEPRRVRAGGDTALVIARASLATRAGVPFIAGGGPTSRAGRAAPVDSYLAAPLGSAASPSGGLAVIAAGARRFADWERAGLAALARRLSRELTWVSAHGRLLAEHARQRTAAVLDGLLGVYTRSAFDGAIAAEMKAARRRNEPLSYALFDLVGLRAINEQHGHATGDRALQHLTAVLRDELRANDLIGRVGDDELGIVLVGAELVSARGTIERILTGLAARPLQLDGASLPLQVRVGLSPILAAETGAARASRRARDAMREARPMALAIESPGSVEISDFDDDVSDLYDMRALLAGPAATTLGGMYLLRHEISRGAHGVVYRGEDLGLNRPVAIKMLRSDLASDDELIDLFRSEAALLAAVHHPNLVQVYSFGSEGGEVYFVMELVEGESLAQLMKRTEAGAEPLDHEALTKLVAEIAGALGTLHRVGVLHRDVKPANILLDRVRDRAVLVDVGVAGRYDAKRFTAGTPGYAAPESLTHRPEVPASDVYGLATTMYALLTGQPPFGSGDIDSVLTRQLLHPPTPPSRVRPAVPAAVDRVLLRAMSAEPAARYATAAEFAAAFAEGLRPAAAPLQLIAKQVAARVRRAAEGKPEPVTPPPVPSSSAAPEMATHRMALPRDRGPLQCRGLFFRVAARVLRDELGGAWLAAVADEPPGLRALLDPGLAVTSWHPLGHLAALLRHAGAAPGDPDRLARALGRASMTAGLDQILGADPRSMTPGALLAACESYWIRLFGGMEVDVAPAIDGQADIALVPGPGEPLVCALIAGALARIAELAGGRQVVASHPDCTSSGGATCRFSITWQPT
jgi:diguanylate cyclase (GGDEF)-like protein